jgi:pimeloyl-ACP methyl ester carboxylesterase
VTGHSSGINPNEVTTMPFIETNDGTRLHYQDRGEGEPIVLIHGWTLGAEVWERQTAGLAAQGLRCVAYDRRGSGQSGRPVDGYDYGTLADDLAALMERLDLRGATLVGHSMGGGEVARYVARHGTGRVARAVFVAATTPFLLRTEDNPDGVDREVFDGMIAGLRADREGYLAASAPTFFGDGLPSIDVPPETRERMVRLACSCSPEAVVATVRSFSETDFRADLRAFAGVPTLVVHGDADANVPLDLCGRRTAASIPGSRLEVYEGAPHGLPITHADRLNRDLLAFVRA